MIQLRVFVRSVINSFLGPNKSNKFVIQDKDMCFARCPLLIFQNMPFQDPVSSLVEETLIAHHDLYGCSTLSLLAMWYLWNEEFRLAIDEGCEIGDIIKHSQNILEQVILALSRTAVNFNKMIFKKQNLLGKTKDMQMSFSQVPKSIQYSSRHFSPAGNFSKLENDCEFDKCLKLDESCLKTAVQSLKHDENDELSDLIVTCWKRQTLLSNCSQFNADGIYVLPMLLPCSSSSVIDGLVIKSYLNYSWNHDMKNICSNRSLLVKGSISYEYAHLGFSPKVKISVQRTSLTTSKEIWIEKICEFIKQLNVDLLLIKGDIEPQIATFCLAHSMLVLPHIPLTLFKRLSNALQYSPCTYIMDCTEKDIIKNLVVKLWKPDDRMILKDQYFSIQIDPGNTVKLQTIVLCHPCPAVLECTEHQMHHLISRLSLSSTNNTLLPGGGMSEDWCFRYFNELPQFHDLSDPTSRIMKALADGFKNYATIVSKKKLLCSNQVTESMDEMSSKLNAWRSALSLLLLTLQCDSVVINGSDDINLQNLCANTL